MKPLTPEQRRAIAVFEANYQYNGSAIRISNVCLDQITVTDSKQFVIGKLNLRDLPHESHWVWHQSNSKRCVQTKFGDVIITKQTPRKLDRTDRCPSYKLWMFEVVHSAGPLYFIWCEKGKADIYASPPMARIRSPRQNNHQSDPIAVEDLAFLKDFIDPSLAIQFGWTCPEATQISFQL